MMQQQHIMEYMHEKKPRMQSKKNLKMQLKHLLKDRHTLDLHFEHS